MESAILRAAQEGDYDAAVHLRTRQSKAPEVIEFLKKYNHPKHRPRSMRAKTAGFWRDPNRIALALAKGLKARNVGKQQAVQQAVDTVNRSFSIAKRRERARAELVEANMRLSWKRTRPPHLSDDDHDK